MDYRKLEAALASELADAPRDTTHSIFVHTTAPLDANQSAELAAVGVKGQPGGQIFTATISGESLDKISELPWIKSISLAKKRRPL